jgi:tripartite-type tricarboxylate transporter receptor subunit TctC
MITRRHLIQGGAAGLGASALGLGAATAAVIDKPAKLILGFVPGGSTDVVSRLLVNQLKDYASNFIVDNRPGAGGRIGIQAVKASPPDGATLGLSPASTLFIYPHVYSNLGYDPLKDFEYACTACTVTFCLAVGPMVPESVKTFQQFVDWCRANPDKASYGSSGAGSMPHFAGALIQKSANFPFVHVAYRGATPAVQDLVAGQIAANLAVITNILPFLEGGKVRVLATTGEKRSPFIPNAPTLGEVGMKNTVIEEPFVMYMPAGTPAKVITEFNELVRKALSVPEVTESYRKLALEPGRHEGQALHELMRKEIDRWGDIVKATGFKME